MTTLQTLPRSFLYVPGHRKDLVKKALRSEADAIILDLEDGVPKTSFDQAVRTVRNRLNSEETTWADLWIRVSDRELEEVSDLFGAPQLKGIVIANCEGAIAREVAGALHTRAKSVPVVGLVESATGLRDLNDIAMRGDVSGFGIGLVDLLADLRVGQGTERVIENIFLQVVIASAAAGLAAPVAPTRTDFRDLETFRATMERYVALGFRSRTAIHPAQVKIIHEVLAPSRDEISAAERLVHLFEGADRGVALDDHGRMIDAAVVRGAIEVLARAEKTVVEFSDGDQNSGLSI